MVVGAFLMSLSTVVVAMNTQLLWRLDLDMQAGVGAPPATRVAPEPAHALR